MTNNGTRVWAVLGLLAAVLVGLALWMHLRGESGDGADGPDGPEPSKAHNLHLSNAVGVYAGWGAKGVRGAAEFAGEFAVDVHVVADYAPRNNWDAFVNPDGQLKAWQQTDYVLDYGVAPFPIADDGTPMGTLAGCAAGEYDAYYSALGEQLVLHELDGTILRFGWEFNGGWYPWSAKDDPALYVDCFQTAVNAFRRVEGNHFSISWSPNIGKSAIAADTAWPGAEYVDFIGVDVYDVGGPSKAYPYTDDDLDSLDAITRQHTLLDDHIRGPYGLNYWRDFAQHQGVQLALSEWGLWHGTDGTGGGDNAEFIVGIAEWMRNPASDVAYHTYFDGDNLAATTATGDTYKLLHKISGDSAFPRGKSAYRHEFGGA